MPTHVYANGREIACQAADGIASPAFPDPCWTPPPPPVGPVVIPYANTARPKTLKKGSRKVFIGGKPVALGDRSYFSTSIGDEPATHALAKGVISGVIKGKAYFRSWSMNVIIEGHGVARHLDRMTHNHGSNPGNTPPFPYVSRAWHEKICKDDRENTDKKCKPTPKEENKSNDAGKKWHWTDDHCASLKNTPGKFDEETYVKDLKEILENVSNEKEALARIESVLSNLAINGGKGSAAAGHANAIRKRLDEIIGKFKSFKGLNLKGKDDFIAKLMPDNSGQRAALNTALATLNDCLLARKCRLVPYENKRTNDGHEDDEPANNGGCCPGQTGHHLIYDVMARPGKKQGEGGDCPGYDTGDAFTVCVEGKNQYHGTHGLVHVKMDTIVSGLVQTKQLEPDGKMNLTTAIDAATQSHAEAFPLSECSPDCIKAQLGDYYGNTCDNGQFATLNKRGKPHKPANGGQTFER